MSYIRKPDENEKNILNQQFDFKELTPQYIRENNITSIPYAGNEEFVDLARQLERNIENSPFGDISQRNLYQKIRSAVHFSLMKSIQDDQKLDEEKQLPFPKIYQQHPLFNSERGRELKAVEELTTQSSNFGLMKSYDPLPQNDILKRVENFPYHRPVDNNYYKVSEFTNKILDKKFHTFSCSISGFMLVQMKYLIAFIGQQINNANPLPDAQKICDFLKLTIAIVQLNAGGHSLYEFFAVLEIEEIKQNFQEKWGIDITKKIGLEACFYDKNQKNLSQAIDKTIEYQTILEHRNNLQHELKNLPQKFNLKPTKIKR